MRPERGCWDEQGKRAKEEMEPPSPSSHLLKSVSLQNCCGLGSRLLSVYVVLSLSFFF